MQPFDAAVIGAGVVGLACGKALAEKGYKVAVLEKETAPATKTTARNSQVIHSGIYYPAGSHKALLCLRGAQMLYDYCAARGIAHAKVGKLIVAADTSEHAALERWFTQGQANGVEGLAMLSQQECQRLEPNVQCTAGMLSPQEGIVDVGALCAALAQDIVAAGGEIITGCAVERVHGSYRLDTSRGVVAAARVVNAAGFDAPRVAGLFEGMAPEAIPRAYFAKGHYFRLRAPTPPFSRLIYPLPNSAGLGTHLTVTLDGQTWFGPDVEWVETPDNVAVDAGRKAQFVRDIRQYYPGLQEEALEPFFAGIRAKIVGPGEAAADFMLQQPLPGAVMLFGIESPGLTSCLAIAERVVGMVG